MNLRENLRISEENLNEINKFLLQENNPLIDRLIDVVEKYGGIEEINRKAKEARKLDNLMTRLEKYPDLLKDINWLIEQRDSGAFVKYEDYRRKVLDGQDIPLKADERYEVTLEISACQYFAFLIEEAKKAIENQDLMASRFIRVRKMKEQEEDGDILAMAAAMNILGASYVETLDTKGTMPGPDGAPVNIHLGGPDTITGYFGGVGHPNECAIQWIDEFLYYYTNYGVPQVLNINPGTIILGYLLYKLGVDMEFKISVFVGNDNPYACFWTMMTAKLFSREDGSTPLIGFNLSNSVNNTTLEEAAYIREAFGFTKNVRLEHHIIETYKSIVRQPYDRTEELVELSDHVENVSAKHEGGLPEIDQTRDHPSDILDYFRDRSEIIESGDWDHLRTNYLDRHHAINNTANAWCLSK